MQVLLDFLRRYNYLFLFVVLEIFSIVSLVEYNNYQGSAWMSAANGAVAEVNSIYTDAESFIKLREVNTELNSANTLLQQENEALRQALLDATHDTTLTERRIQQELVGFNQIPAKVISNKVCVGANNYLVVNKGTADGVRAEMGVVSSGGVVGIVYLSGAHTSIVLPVTHSKSSISCSIRGQSYFGYLQWDGRNTRTAYVDDIPRYAKINKGCVVQTSGYSNVFPPGIFVGRVTKVGNSSDGQSYRLDIVLGNDFASLRDVNIIATPYKAEIDTLNKHALQLTEQPE